MNRGGEPHTSSGLLRIIKRLGRKADTKNRRLSALALRPTLATLYMKEGGDVHSLQRLLGHSDIRTCAIYVEMSGKALRDAHRRASPADNLMS